MSRSVLTGGRRRRRRWPGWLARAAALLALAALSVVLTRGEEEPAGPRGPGAEMGGTGVPAAGGGVEIGGRTRGEGGAPAPPGGGEDAAPDPPAASESSAGDGRAVRSPLAVRLAEKPDPIRLRFRDPPRSGLLFDLDSGRVLWRHAPRRVLPIASLTKLMTALLAAERLPRGRRVLVTAGALRYRGSGVGLLPRGKRIRWTRCSTASCSPRATTPPSRSPRPRRAAAGAASCA